MDFVLEKSALETDDQDLDSSLPFMGNYASFDPFNQYARYNTASDLTQNQEERTEKPWWWSYFIQSGGPPPTWLLKM